MTDQRQSATSSASGYFVTDQQRTDFQDKGFVLLPGVMSELEMATHVDEVIKLVYFKFLRGELDASGSDCCDMSGVPGRERGEFSILNVMLPRLYHPPWQGNLLETRCLSIAQQLIGGDAALDFDQILAKKPHSDDSVMAWHQDSAYWPPLASDTATANCWVAVSDVPLASGCMRYLPASNKEPSLRVHRPVAEKREQSHAIKTDVDEGLETVVPVPMRRGDVLVHDERVVHGSSANRSDEWRCAYVLNFKHAACIAEERSMGFTHSHNESLNWDKFQAV
ncbi:MAG: hypothetical protein WDW36_008120 [Sanguina aurantia]